MYIYNCTHVCVEKKQDKKNSNEKMEIKKNKIK